FVCFIQYVFFQLRELGNRVDVFGMAEQLLLRQLVAGRAVAADADADEARAAALSLRLVYRVQNALADAVEVAARFAEPFELGRQAVLDVLVLAAAALQDQADFDVVPLPLLEVDDRRAWPEVVPGVLARQRIDRVRPELPVFGRARDRAAD